MPDALIGHTGFVGSNLSRQMPFDEFYNSKNIDDIRGRRFSLVVCAAAPGRKWYANQHPREDWATIARLLEAVKAIDAERFVLISTVDVYANPVGVDEDTLCTTQGLHWYGINRLVLEIMVRQQFGDRAAIIRLPALFGPGLKKNALYDMMVGNEVEKIPANATYQWWNVDDVATCIIAMAKISGFLPLANVVSPPVEMSEIRDRFFPGARLGRKRQDAPRYDVRSGAGYLENTETVLREMGEWLTFAMSTARTSPGSAMRAVI